jgi:AcrR family transcriptional regulator
MGDRHADRKAARREQLLDAAVDAIRRQGPGVSMHDLAAAAGVTKPILYRYFGDRDGLVTALAARFSAELLASLRAALVRGTGDARGSVTATVDAFVAFLEREPEVYRLLVQQARAGGLTPLAAEPRQPGAADVIGGFLRQVGDDVAIVLGEQLRAAGRDSGGAEVLAHGIVGFVHAAGDWWIERRTMPRQRLVAYVTDLLWGGLASLGLEGDGT